MVGFHKQNRPASPCFLILVLYALNTILRNLGLVLINSGVKIHENVSLGFPKLDYYRNLVYFRLVKIFMLILLIFWVLICLFFKFGGSLVGDWLAHTLHLQK